MVELAGDILTLSIEMFVNIIFMQLLKTTNIEKTIWPRSYRFFIVKVEKKLYCVIWLKHLKMLVLLL